MRLWILQIAALVLASQVWAADGFPVEAEFNAVDGVAQELIVAVGNRGVIMHFPPGEAGYYVPSHTERDLLDVYVGSRDFAVAVGPGVLLHWDGVEWSHVNATPVTIREGWVWSTPDRGLILYGGRTENAGRLCAWRPSAARQPFCRSFGAPVRVACGHRDEVLLLLANGDIHRVNNALIGRDASFLPVYRAMYPLELNAAWLPEAECDPAGEDLPEVFAVRGEGGLVHFDGVAWRALDELPAKGIAGRSPANHPSVFIQIENPAGDHL